MCVVNPSNSLHHFKGVLHIEQQVLQLLSDSFVFFVGVSVTRWLQFPLSRMLRRRPLLPIKTAWSGESIRFLRLQQLCNSCPLLSTLA